MYRYKFDKRINIFTGHYGSGKTEAAINFALILKKLFTKVAIVDLDIVNPFFRTADAKLELENIGIKTILPVFAGTNSDVPALPGEINSIFQNEETKTVIDVGGDDAGAKALSRYRNDFISQDFEMFCVINTCRPMTDTSEKIKNMIWEIESSSRLKITNLINNTNLMENTTIDIVMEGHRKILEVSRDIKIPLAFACGMDKSFESEFDKIDTDYILLTKKVKTPWDKG